MQSLTTAVPEKSLRPSSGLPPTSTPPRPSSSSSPSSNIGKLSGWKAMLNRNWQLNRLQFHRLPRALPNQKRFPLRSSTEPRHQPPESYTKTTKAARPTKAVSAPRATASRMAVASWCSPINTRRPQSRFRCSCTETVSKPRNTSLWESLRMPAWVLTSSSSAPMEARTSMLRGTKARTTSPVSQEWRSATLPSKRSTASQPASLRSTNRWTRFRLRRQEPLLHRSSTSPPPSITSCWQQEQLTVRNWVITHSRRRRQIRSIWRARLWLQDLKRDGIFRW